MVNLQGVKGLSGTGIGDASAIIEVLSRVLTQLIDLNRNVTSKQQLITKFQSSYPPTISILAYLERINKYAKCSPNCFIVALIYIDRLIETRNVILSTLNVHRVLITSIMLATKVHDDEFYKNAYYAKLGGVSTQEINSLELEFLSLMNFDFFVTVEVFEKYQKELAAFVAPAVSAAAAPALSDTTGGCAGTMFEGQCLGQDASGGALERGLGLGLNTPSPPVMLSCGQYKAVTTAGMGCNQQSQPHLLGGLGMGQPPSDMQQQQQFVTVTPPPLVSPSIQQQGQQSFFSGQAQVPLSLDHHMQQHQAQQQHHMLVYPVCGGEMFSHPQQPQQQQGMGLGMNMGMGGVGMGMYSGASGAGGGGCGVGGLNYITPVTTPTSVADQVFSWGGGGDSAAGLVGKSNGGMCGGSASVVQQQQQQLARLHQPTQLFPTNYYHPAAGTNSSSTGNQQQVQMQSQSFGPSVEQMNRQVQQQQHQQQGFAMPSHGCHGSYLHQSHMKQQQVQQVTQQQQLAQHQYFYPPHPSQHNYHLSSLPYHHEGHQQQHQRFVVTAGGGGRGGVCWGTAGP